MPHQSGREFFHGPPTTNPNMDLAWPFGKLEGLDCDDIREAAYEIFFTACRSSPGFGGRNVLTFHSSHDNGDGGNRSGPGSPGRRVNNGVATMNPTSKIKKALGLKMMKKTHSRRMSICAMGFSNGGGNGSGGSSPSPPVSHHGHSASISGFSHAAGLGFSTLKPPNSRRPLTSAEIMKQQMRVSEQSDNRLRKSLMRTLVGQMGRRPETIILPLELLRHLKPSEFNDLHEYHIWQKRQLKILEVGLLLYPSIPTDKSNPLVIRLHEIIRAGDLNPIDTSKNSDMMRSLCNVVVSLAWRGTNGTPTDVCHWADGYPFNIHMYISLLQAIFDVKDEIMVLDEVDELLELMKKTWSTLGINRSIHNACFTWVLFQQYVVTNQIEPNLLSAAYTMLTEVEIDARKPDKETTYVKVLSSMLVSIKSWVEKRLLYYHECFNKGNIDEIENLLPLALFSAKVLSEDVGIMEGEGEGSKKGDVMLVDSTSDCLDRYIRSSVKNAFAKMIENENVKHIEENEGPSVALLDLAKETEDLAAKERELFSPILKKWHPIAGGVAAVTLHQCYGTVLKQYLAETIMLTDEIVGVLQRAEKLEKVLVQMVVEDSEECDDGGKGIIREMIPYEFDSTRLKLLRQWIDERLNKEKELLCRVKETETWNPKSKSEPYTQSCMELMRSANQMVKDFFDIPIGITDDLILDLAEGLKLIFQEYITFVASCGSKESHLPELPPLTRCNRDSKFFKLWRKANPCSVGIQDMHQIITTERNHTRPSMSRGTQRLYVRLNTLHYLISHLHSLDNTLTLSPKVSTTRTHLSDSHKHCGVSPSHFKYVNTLIQSACDHVSEVAAYRLVFLDSKLVFYESLYVGEVGNARIRPLIKVLKHNLTLLTAILTDKVQALATKEIMKASFEAFVLVLLAGGPSRFFERSDHQMIEEDFESLKRVFCTCGEGLIPKDVVQSEAEPIEGVIALMGQSTEQLAEDLSIISRETSGIGATSPGQKLPMPPTTRRWNSGDPNTILRVLCHRNDREANQFLKKEFQLPKRK
ncbi:hypothetical protein J1N35_037357 [Gossypium stocksii]|uniref:MHD1 domain-containing protein n=1 Tax=Gossypium stocksii TaxID=47602 RepID=A0A9D3UJZ8_9ROSI|nr:hypothetical protein J1N35_037357 [Gossypium stocksii]